MAKIRKVKFEQRFENLAVLLTKFTGSTVAFISALMLIIIWGVSGPVFNYSEGWQLVINTGTTIITFLMVFLIQRAQNKDSLAIQLKLNEIIAATSGASNTLVDIEELKERDLEILRNHYRKLAKLFEKDVDLTKSHTVEEAETRHKRKLKTIK
ncbi:MAG TPA: low affinity iron permease family protein [Ignavibacteria bacterium]|nr:low affinity iron permease family protein [Ignavibacteria bacterium]